MSKDLISIQPKGGVTRLKNADQSRPYRLENCQVELNGFVRSVNAPSNDTSETNESKPYSEWNSKMLSRTSYSQNESQTQITARALSDAAINARLYRSVKGLDSEVNDNYRIVKFFSDYDQDTNPDDKWQGEPAIAYTSTSVEEDPTQYGIINNNEAPLGNVEENAHVGYLAIPYDKNGEAGNLFYFTTPRKYRKLTSVAGNIGNMTIPRLVTVTCNDETEFVKIYRSLDYNDRGYVHTGPEFLNDVAGSNNSAVSIKQQVDHRYFFLGTYHTSINGTTNNKQIQYTDNKVWITEIMFAVLLNQLSITDSRTLITWTLQDTLPFSLLTNEIEAPTNVLQVQYNHHSIHTAISSFQNYQYHGVGANVMAAQSNIVLYGDVRFPTKRTLTGVAMYKNDGSSANIEAQLEYVDSKGKTYYGPKETYLNVAAIKFVWQGTEAALLIFRGGQLYERLTPNAFGAYVSVYKRAQANSEGFTVPISYIVDSDNSSALFDEEPGAVVVDYIHEPNVVFISEDNTGMTVSTDSFVMKADETVRAITPARLAEDESIRDYDFYVFTDKSITLYKRSGNDLRTILPVHNVTNNLGVLQANFTAIGTEPTLHNLVSLTRFGVTFVGTDNNVYHLVGRDLQRLDIEIPGLFDSHGGYRDIVYHPNCNQIWVLFNFATIWIYDFDQQGWTKQHFLEDVHYNIYYRESTRNMHSWGNIASVQKTFKFDEVATNIHAKPQYITQPIEDRGQEWQIVRMEIDYATTGYSETNRDTWAKLRHSIRHSSIVGSEESFDAANGRRLVEYDIPANRTFFPPLVGRGHQFKLSNFQELRDIEIFVNKTQ